MDFIFGMVKLAVVGFIALCILAGLLCAGLLWGIGKTSDKIEKELVAKEEVCMVEHIYSKYEDNKWSFEAVLKTPENKEIKIPITKVEMGVIKEHMEILCNHRGDKFISLKLPAS